MGKPHFKRKPPPRWACGGLCASLVERRPGATEGPVSSRPSIERNCYLPTQRLVAACVTTLASVPGGRKCGLSCHCRYSCPIPDETDAPNHPSLQGSERAPGTALLPLGLDHSSLWARVESSLTPLPRHRTEGGIDSTSGGSGHLPAPPVLGGVSPDGLVGTAPPVGNWRGSPRTHLFGEARSGGDNTANRLAGKYYER